MDACGVHATSGGSVYLWSQSLLSERKVSLNRSYITKAADSLFQAFSRLSSFLFRVLSKAVALG